MRQAHATSRGGRGEIAVPIGGIRRLVGFPGDDLGPKRGIGREHAMEANEMEPGTWDECCQALQEFQRAHHKMGDAIAVRGFELEDDLAGRGAAYLLKKKSSLGYKYYRGQQR